MLLAMLVAAAVSFASTPMVKALACKVGAIDVPKDNRRMHKVPIPRMGGLAIFLAFLLSVLVFADIDRQMQGILLGSIMIVILGVLDDIMALKALPKLFVHIEPRRVIVVEGIMIFVDKTLCDEMNIRIFVDADADVRLCRRIRRDVKKRGRSIDSVIDQYLTTVKPMHELYVEPSKKNAHIIVPEGGKNLIALEMIINRIQRHIDASAD